MRLGKDGVLAIGEKCRATSAFAGIHRLEYAPVPGKLCLGGIPRCEVQGAPSFVVRIGRKDRGHANLPFASASEPSVSSPGLFFVEQKWYCGFKISPFRKRCLWDSRGTCGGTSRYQEQAVVPDGICRCPGFHGSANGGRSRGGRGRGDSWLFSCFLPVRFYLPRLQSPRTTPPYGCP